MNSIARVTVLAATGLLLAVSVSAHDEQRVFNLGDFTFESGETVPDAYITYVTYGQLNGDKSNVVVLPSWYSGTHDGQAYLVGADKSLDPNDYFIVTTDMFSNGLSSSPSNTAPPHDGPRFPEVGIRDNVRAIRQLLQEEFEVDHIRAIIGFSMGAQQALQWGVSYPDSAEVIVAICGNAKEYPFGYARLEGAKAALMADSAWMNGNYKSPPVVGLRALARHWTTWGVSAEFWRQETYRLFGATSIEEAIAADEEYMLSRDANNLLSQAVTWQQHNVADTPGFDGDFDKALASIKARVLLMPSSTDLYFPAADAVYEHARIPNSTLAIIDTIWGHSAIQDPEAAVFINRTIRNFLDSD